jgi:hypothetical protein
VPFPKFPPELPEDDPISALRNLRAYVRSVVELVPVPLLLSGTAVALIVAFALGCLFFGFNEALSWAVDLVPFSFAVISVFVSVKKLRDEHHNAVIVFVLFLGAAGTVFIHYAKARADVQHQQQLDTLGKKLDSVDNRNSQLLDIVLRKPELTEAERREGIVKALTNKYILTHEDISPGLLSGIESPPTDWMNKQLAELGEKWKVSGTTKTPPPIQLVQPEKSRVEFSFTPVVIEDWPVTTKYLPRENGAVEVKLTYRTFEHTAKGLRVWLRLCDACSYSKEPDNFQNLKPTTATERMLIIGDFLPGPVGPEIIFSVIPPPNSDSFVVGLFYGCDNCDPLDPAKPQLLTVRTTP